MTSPDATINSTDAFTDSVESARVAQCWMMPTMSSTADDVGGCVTFGCPDALMLSEGRVLGESEECGETRGEAETIRGGDEERVILR